MTSNDNFITIEIFNNGIQEIKTEIQEMNLKFEQKFDKLENLIETEIRLNNQAHEHLQTSIYWGFAIIAIVIAFVGFMITLAPSILEYFKSKQKNYATTEQVQEIVDRSIARALSRG